MNPDESVESALPASRDPKAGWWCWPVILLVLVFFAWIAPGLEGEEPLETEGPAVEEVDLSSDEVADWTQLAMLKLQGQVAIATASVKESDARLIVKDLKANVRGAYSISALAILVNFLDLDSGGEEEALELIQKEMDRGEHHAEILNTVTRGISNGVTSSERDEVTVSLGWFANLLPQNVNGEKKDPPGAGEVRNQSMIVLVCVFIVLGIAGFASLAGLILLIVYLTFRSGNPSIQKFRPGQLPSGILLESFAIYLAVMAVGELSGFYLHWTASLFFYPFSFIAAIFWPRIRGVEWRATRQSIGWHRGKGFLRELGAGVVGYLGILPIAAGGIILTALLIQLSGHLMSKDEIGGGEAAMPQPSHPIVGAIMQGGIWMKLACLLLASGFAPFIEETLFRGALHRHLRSHFPFLISALAGGFVFAALHPQGWLAIPALTAMGIGFALIREWRDSLIAPMVAHALNNGFIVVLFSLVL